MTWHISTSTGCYSQPTSQVSQDQHINWRNLDQLDQFQALPKEAKDTLICALTNQPLPQRIWSDWIYSIPQGIRVDPFMPRTILRKLIHNLGLLGYVATLRDNLSFEFIHDPAFSALGTPEDIPEENW